jgi:acetyltransferase-like isoleucine patch superfamily enzyme
VLLKKMVQFMLTPLPSCLKKPIYRLLGAKIGPGATIAPLTICVSDRIELGPHAKIKPLSIIYSPRELCVGAYAVIGNLSVIHGPGAFRLGPRSYISAGGMIDLYRDVVVGEFTAFGPRCTLMTHGLFWPASWGLARKIGGISVGDLSWVANNCTITADVKIGSRVMVMAGSVVTKDIDGPGMVSDVPRNRTVLPYHRVQKTVTEAQLRKLIDEVSLAGFDEVLRPAGWSLERRENLWEMRKRGRLIRIRFFENVENRPNAPDADWFFGFNYDDRTLSGEHGAAVLDFLRLLHTPRPERMLKRWLEYFRHMWGIRFADYRYRGCFNVMPPRLPPASENANPELD